MPHYHLVTGYETLRRIAALYGAAPSQIWNAGQNAELRRVRTPDHLCEGDRVWIPGEDHSAIIEVDGRPIPLRTGSSYTLSLPQTHEVAVQFRNEENEPMANWECELSYPGGSLATSFDGSGILRATLPLAVLSVEVTYWPSGGEREHAYSRSLQVGRLDPVETESGVVASLQNLGYGTDGASLGTAIADFQADNDMEVTGRIDDALRERLRSTHRAGGR